MLGYKLPRPLPVPELSQLLGLELWMVLPYGQNVGCLFALLLLGLFWWGQRDSDFPFPSLYETCSSGRLSPSKFSAFKSNLVSACAPLRTAATRTRCPDACYRQAGDGWGARGLRCAAGVLRGPFSLSTLVSQLG